MCHKAGKHATEITLMFFIRFHQMRNAIQWYFCMVMDNRAGVGKPPLMAEKVLLTSFYERAIAFILLISPVVVMQDRLQNQDKLPQRPMIKPGIHNFESVYIPNSTKAYNFRKIQHRSISSTE